jgi:hypothetical protein
MAVLHLFHGTPYDDISKFSPHPHHDFFLRIKALEACFENKTTLTVCVGCWWLVLFAILVLLLVHVKIQ